MNWKQSLDRYLTTPPEDRFDNYCDEIIECVSKDFYDNNEDWLNSQEATNIMDSYFRSGITPKEAAILIESNK